MILDTIINRIGQQYADEFARFSGANTTLKERTKPLAILPLIEKEFFVIAECKKGSPSKGIICADYNPSTIAHAYQQNGANAISVITETNFFFGNPQDLQEVKEMVEVPVLRKDFIIHPMQVYQSYNLGADFILLIAACLNDQELQNLYSLALSLDMHVLIEIHNHHELTRVLPLKPLLIGINNRNLHTFVVDIETSFYLKKLIPRHIHVISESGIQTPEHIQRLKQAGFAGVLVGETLLRHPFPGQALKELLHVHN